MEVYHITPYLTGDIGKAINQSIQPLPEDAWICLRDTDTMFLTPQQGAWVELVARSNPPFDLIGCSTNRLASGYQLFDGICSDVTDISEHQRKAFEAIQKYGLEIEEVPNGTPLAGMFMLFRKSLWNEFKFEERSVQFDLILSDALHKAGKRLGILRGLYLFHLYRLGADNPAKATAHLAHCQDFSKIYIPEGYKP